MTHTLPLLGLLLALAGPALAQSHSHAGHSPGAAALASPAPTPTRAVVRKVDTSAQKITLRHERIENLDMDAMTMVFQVQDPALLGKVQAGDTVRFTADQVQGAYTVLSIERVQP